MPKTSGSFKKGHKGVKPKGALNRTTKEAHEFFMFIMNGEVNHIQDSLTKIRNDDPEKYINALTKLLQYYIPRKTDITSGEEKISIQLPNIIIQTPKVD
jgi:hypothetical protein